MILDKKIKIAHLILGEEIGGVERLFADFINASKELYEHYVVTKSGLHPYLFQDVVNSVEEIYSLSHVYNVRIPKIFRPIKFNLMKNLLLSKNFDLWLLWDSLPPSLSFFSLLKQTHSKCIFYEHGKAWGKKTYKKKKYHMTLDKSNIILCVSNAAKKMLELRVKTNNPNIRVILNPLRPSCKVDSPKMKTLDKEKHITLGIAGRHVSYKGFPLVIHAVKELKERKIPFKLLVAGVGEKLEDLKKLVLKLDLNSDVEFLGLLNKMEEFYNKIDLFICPSLRDPYPLSVIEAMAHGCPVIVSGVDGLYEMINGTNAGVIIKPTIDYTMYPSYGGSLDFLKKIDVVYDPYLDIVTPPKFIDPVDLAISINVLWDNPEKFNEMSKNAIDSINKKFNLDNYMMCMTNTIKEVVTL